MTKTIEELKSAKRELELKISQMVNEFAKERNIACNVKSTYESSDAIVLEIELKL